MPNVKGKDLSEIDVKLDFPKTQNMHQIDVYEENGHTIGILNFGERTVKIITDGDIVLVRRDKEKQPKSKRR